MADVKREQGQHKSHLKALSTAVAKLVALEAQLLLGWAFLREMPRLTAWEEFSARSLLASPTALEEHLQMIVRHVVQ